MSDQMSMSLGSILRPVPQSVFHGTSESESTAIPKRSRRMRTGWLLAIWAFLSIVWAGGVTYDLYQRISLQADMSVDVERDLDQGFVTASCAGAQCGGTMQKTINWSGIAATYLKFGSTDVAECAFGPPIILLAFGIGTVFMLRRRGAR